MKFLLLAYVLSSASLIYTDLSDHLKNVGPKEHKKQIQEIDYIYLINLDQRPEKWEACKKQLASYEITPHRFSAIYGWDLSIEARNEVGLKFESGMQSDKWIVTFPKKLRGVPDLDFLREELYGTSVFCHWMKPGAIGCYLSHLSVLQDAYNSGYETIWILEDDISVEKDPHVLSQYIKKLDKLVGKDGWDILYTDMDFDEETYLQAVKEMPHFFWRPDLDSSSNSERLINRKIISEDFLAIGSRSRTHSMVVRRLGMKKILDHAKKHHIFLPYDHELAVVSELKLFNVRDNIVTAIDTMSDTFNGDFSKQKKWDEYRKKTIEDSKNISGWNNSERADKIMQLLYEIRPNICVEIGCFAGATSYQIAKTLSFLQKGKLYTIDAWDLEIASEGIKNPSLIQTFRSIDWKAIQKECENLLRTREITSFCTLIHEKSDRAVSRFSEEEIDFLYIDGNPSSKGSLADVSSYLPKVKKGGYICLNGANTLEKAPSIALLLKQCIWFRDEFNGSECLLFQKK